MRQMRQSSLPIKSRYFLTTNQLFCFCFDIDKVICTDVHTYMHAHQQMYIYRDIHTFLHTCMNSYIITSPHHYPIVHRQWENSLINSGYFYKRLFMSSTTQRRCQPQQLTLCRSLHAEALQATVSEGLAHGPWRGG